MLYTESKKRNWPYAMVLIRSTKNVMPPPPYLFLVKAVEKDDLEYTILCSVFFSMAIYVFAFINFWIIFTSHFLFLKFHYPALYITIYQNDDLQKITSFTDSDKVSVQLIVFKTLYHHFFVFCSDRSLICHCFNCQLLLFQLPIVTRISHKIYQ